MNGVGPLFLNIHIQKQIYCIHCSLTRVHVSLCQPCKCGGHLELGCQQKHKYVHILQYISVCSLFSVFGVKYQLVIGFLVSYCIFSPLFNSSHIFFHLSTFHGNPFSVFQLFCRLCSIFFFFLNHCQFEFVSRNRFTVILELKRQKNGRRYKLPAEKSRFYLENKQKILARKYTR